MKRKATLSGEWEVERWLWAAIPPGAAGRLAIENAEALDRRLETYPPDLLEALCVYNPRWVERSLHRNAHLDEADAGLRE